MELEVKRRKAQIYIQQGIGVGIIVLAAVYLFYMTLRIESYYLLMAFGRGVLFLTNISIGIVYILIVVIGALVMRFAAVRLHSILTKECDPYLYEACISGQSRLVFKDRLLVNLALAQHSQGDYERAWRTLQEINVHRIKGAFRANYYILLSDQYFKRGMGEQVRGLEEAFRHSIRGKRDQKFFEMLCAGNNLTRALENKDYQAAAEFLQKRIELNGTVSHTWMCVGYAFKEAQIYLGLGEKESARMKLEYVALNGRRMWIAMEARRLLSNDMNEGEEMHGNLS